VYATRAQAWALRERDDKELALQREAAANTELTKALGNLTLPGRNRAITCMGFSHDGRFLALGYSGAFKFDQVELKVWDLSTGVETFHVVGQAPEIRSVAFSPDGRRIVMATSGRVMKVLDLATAQELLTLPTGTDPTQCQFRPYSQQLVTINGSGVVMIWDGTPIEPPKK
jgi:WD40 repeat protein